MFVLDGFAGRELGVPLIQLDPVKPAKATRGAVEDWRYWGGDGVWVLRRVRSGRTFAAERGRS